MQEYEIVKVKDGTFVGSDGEDVTYFWVKAKRVSDNVQLEFGTRSDYRGKEGTTVTLELEKREKSNGRVGYVELV